MTETDTRRAEQACALLLEDADAQNTHPCEMTGLLPDDEREIAALIRALLARAEMAGAAFERLSYNLGTMAMERNEAQRERDTAWNDAIEAAAGAIHVPTFWTEEDESRVTALNEYRRAIRALRK